MNTSFRLRYSCNTERETDGTGDERHETLGTPTTNRVLPPLYPGVVLNLPWMAKDNGVLRGVSKEEYGSFDVITRSSERNESNSMGDTQVFLSNECVNGNGLS